MKAEIILWTNDKETAKGFPVIFYYFHNKIRRKIGLGYYFKMDDWNFEKQMPYPSAADFDLVYPKLLNLNQNIKKLIYEGETDLKVYLAAFKPKAIVITNFYDFADKLIQLMQERGKASNADVYQTTINQFKKVFTEIDFKEIDYNSLVAFKNHKLKYGAKNSTIHAYLRTLRAIYNEAVLTGNTIDATPFKNVFKDIAVRKNRTKKKYLTIESIARLEKVECDVITKHADYCRDLFLLQFYFGGQDLIDIYNLKKEQVQDGRIYFERAKLGERGYVFDLVISEKAQLIFDKYANDSPFMLLGRKDYAGYETFRRRYQKYLVDLQSDLGIKVEPMNSNLGIKVARYTFANRGKMIQVDEDLLRELMGHERNDVDTIYKEKHPQKMRDKAHLRIISTN